MRRKLLRKNGRRVHPIGLLQLARQLELRERGHRRLKWTARQAFKIRELPVEVGSLRWKFPIVDDQLPQQQRKERQRQPLQQRDMFHRKLARFWRISAKT